MQTTSLPSRTHARQRGAAPAGGGPGRRRGRQVDREHGYGLCATEAMGARNIDLTKFLFCSMQPSFNCGRERKLSSRPISAGQSMSNSLFSLVLLDNPVTPDMSAVAKVLRARHPELATEVGENGAVQQAQANSPLIRCGNELVAVMSMPARIPDDAGLWSRAAGTWPEEQVGCGAASRASDRLRARPKSASVALRSSDDCCYRRIDRDDAGMLRRGLEWQGRTIRRAMAGLVQPIVCATILPRCGWTYCRSDQRQASAR
ncbi:hypothetical protein ACVWZZ_001180 [Bradyrhizobium sp. LM6.10]